MDDLATWFERSILYGFGRHLWNISGISGVFALFIGILLILSSSGGSSANPKAYKNWLSSDKINAPRVKEILLYLDDESEEKRKQSKARCIAQWQYQNAEFYCEQPLKPDSELSSLMSQYESEYVEYKLRLEGDAQDSNSKAESRGTAGRAVSAWGIGMISVASVISAVLSIERNTRE